MYCSQNNQMCIQTRVAVLDLCRVFSTAMWLFCSKTSGVDGRPLDGVCSVRVLQDIEFESDGRAIRCTEVRLLFNYLIVDSQASGPPDSPLNLWMSLQVFYQLKTPDCSLASVLSSCSAFQKEIALAACSALTPHLTVLTSSGINMLSLRISTQADMVKAHWSDVAF